MESELNKLSRIVTARINVPKNTTSKSPLTVKLTSPLPILQELKIIAYSAAGAVTEIESGWQLISGGLPVIPALGSYDDLTNEVYAPIINGFAFESGQINQQLQGPPFKLEFKFYNLDAAAAVYYLIQARVTAKIDPPSAPITADKKESE